jgi:hypothetical protein
MVVVTVIAAVVVMGFRRMRTGAVGIVVMLDLISARMARMRANDRDHARKDGADQRQKNNCLDHLGIPLRMISAQTRSAFVATENRSPLFRIMR